MAGHSHNYRYIDNSVEKSDVAKNDGACSNGEFISHNSTFATLHTSTNESVIQNTESQLLD